jgi:glycosyltransferase involved in cell wall biosynthesis
MPSCVIVVPCYNEAARLEPQVFLDFLSGHPGLSFLFVDDGSTDDTRAVIESLAGRSPRIDALVLARNGGKAEAVRQGFLATLAGDASLIGFWDADLATPLAAIPEFVEVLRARPEAEMVLGSRVKLLGRIIERKPRRHYFGRVSATMASMMLRLPVYDTQCGAKLFRRTPDLSALFDEPFLTRWIFDVEILARWLERRSVAAAERCIVEQPLMEWRDIDGSKLSTRDFLRTPKELLKLRLRYGSSPD